ncbi:hypothetical protein DY245_25330 [Streptomyces inhibens]|uniref:Transposase n=1 Tax=Streptomyces inhibens TaxID=2293571 RepID=A0A371PZ16_STRIH|nr:hypothetical protein DY245_25330 [Streptomyces inhibens]
MERINPEIKRRTNAVQVSPNPPAPERLTTAALCKMHDEWIAFPAATSEGSTDELYTATEPQPKRTTQPADQLGSTDELYTATEPQPKRTTQPADQLGTATPPHRHTATPPHRHTATGEHAPNQATTTAPPKARRCTRLPPLSFPGSHPSDHPSAVPRIGAARRVHRRQPAAPGVRAMVNFFGPAR